jgi:hypothetical protein
MTEKDHPQMAPMDADEKVNGQDQHDGQDTDREIS